MTEEKRGGAREGAGRPENPNKKQTLGTRVHPDAKEKLLSLATKTGLSQAVILEHLLASCNDLPKVLKGFD
jgi:hypothetical protein